MKVMFTGGGTAGHVMPNIALIERFSEAGDECVYVGSADGIERDLIQRLDIPFYAISSGKLRRYFDWRNFTDPFRILLGLLQSLKICWQQQPGVVFSKGGFVAVPLVFAAWILRIPVICHESDVTPGLANRLCFPFSRWICVNFEESLDFVPRDKAIVTGTPVRQSLLDGDGDRGLKFLGFDAERPVLLVFGGSLGARSINDCVRRVLPELLDQMQVVHVTGSDNLDVKLNGLAGFHQAEFLHDEFGDVLAAADVVIARAGANSVYELFITRTPHILIPLSAAASRGDQIVNARTFEKSGYSLVLEEAELTDSSIKAQIDRALATGVDIRQKLSEFAVRDSAGMIEQTIRQAGETR